MQFISDLAVSRHSGRSRGKTAAIDRRTTLALLGGALLGAASGAASAEARLAELGTVLLMVEERGCPYCARFDRETAAGYAASPEGRVAPLVRRPLSDPEVRLFKNVVYTPTFLLLRDGRELGRIVGYPGADLFWMNMATLMRQAGLAPGP